MTISSSLILRKFSLVAFITTLLFGACTKANSEEQNQPAETTAIPVQQIQSCHNSSNPFPSQITDRIVGTWLLEKSLAPMTQVTSTASTYLIVRIDDASTYEIFENGVSIATGIWSLKKFSDTEWELQLTNTNTHVRGTIALCNDELLLSKAYVDGAINYFVRK